VKDHPEFLLSRKKKHQLESAKNHPQPPAPCVLEHPRGHFVLVPRVWGLVIHITTPEENIEIKLAPGQIKKVIDQLLSIEAYLDAEEER